MGHVGPKVLARKELVCFNPTWMSGGRYVMVLIEEVQAHELGDNESSAFVPEETIMVIISVESCGVVGLSSLEGVNDGDKVGILEGKSSKFIKKILRVVFIVDDIDLGSFIVSVSATAKDVGDCVECSWNPLNGKFFSLEVIEPAPLSFGDCSLG